MKKFITPLFLVFVLSGKTQNLVPNFSFEIYSQCPTTYDVLNYAVPWCSIGGPEIFNSCANPSSATGIPYNGSPYNGYQYPHSGTGMAGFNAFVGHYFLREDASTTLKDTMESGKNYCVSFFVNLSNEAKYAIDRLGMCISQTFHPCDTVYNVILTPSIQSTPGTILGDTMNWMKISSTYTATGGEKYILIGNFYTDNNTNRIMFNPNARDSSAYYYLDDVSIEEIKPVALRNDTMLTNCDSVLLGNNLDSASTYAWWPNKNISDTTSPNPTAWPDSTTTYYVTKTQCSSVTTDSIKITVLACDVGIDESKKYFGFKLHPNPNEGLFSVEYKVEQDASMMMYASSGKLTAIIPLEKDLSKKQLDLKELENGIYYYVITVNKEMKQTGKIVITK